jgi:hypothetical protein
MPQTLTGRATISGFTGGVSFTGIGTLFNESYDVAANSTVTELRDGLNKLQGLQFNEGELTMQLNFTPVASSGTNTIADAKASLAAPANGAIVTLSDFDLASLNHARWAYMGDWKIAGKKDGLATYALSIKCSQDASTNIATEIS